MVRVKQLLHRFLRTFHLVRQCSTPERAASHRQPLMVYKQHSRVQFRRHDGGQDSAEPEDVRSLASSSSCIRASLKPRLLILFTAELRRLFMEQAFQVEMKIYNAQV